MKYKDPVTGEWKELYTKTADTLPVGTVVEFEGEEVPAGWEEIDNSWIDAELTEDFKLYSTSSICGYRKAGNIVNIQGQLSPNKADNVLNSGAAIVAFKLPDGYRPKSQTVTLCQGSGTNCFVVSISSEGNVSLSRYRNEAGYSDTPPTTTTWLPFNITYLVD